MPPETKNLTCISCPIGCQLTVEVGDGASGRTVLGVTGNLCPRGKAYAATEITNPVRMLSSTVRVRGGTPAQLPVKTRTPIPKHRVEDCAKALAGIVIAAPVALGQVVLPDVCGTGVDIVATRTIQ